MFNAKTNWGMVALLSAVVIGSTAAMASPDGHHRGHHNPQKRIEKMLDAVDATDAQRQAIRDAMTAQKPDREILRERSKALHSQINALDPLAGDYLEKVNAIAEQKGQITADRFRMHALLKQQIATHLTPEQSEQLKAMKQERRERRQEKWRERRANAGPQ